MSEYRASRRSATFVTSIHCIMGIVCLGTIASMSAQVTVSSSTGNGSGIVMTETATALAAPSSDSIFANSGNHRLNISNNNGSAQLVGIWPCLSANGLGCMPYSSGTNFAETALALGSTVGLPLIAGSGAPQWGGTYLDLQGNPLVIEVATASTSPSLEQTSSHRRGSIKSFPRDECVRDRRNLRGRLRSFRYSSDRGSRNFFVCV